jgi:hypothetical protein
LPHFNLLFPSVPDIDSRTNNNDFSDPQHSRQSQSSHGFTQAHIVSKALSSVTLKLIKQVFQG